MIEFYNYIYKYFKLGIVITLLMFVYIVVYLDGYLAHANDIYISDNYLLKYQIKYTNAMYNLSDENNKLNDNLNKNNNIYSHNTLKHNFKIYINNLGINESLFALPMTYNKKDYDYINSKKSDPNLIDFELIDVTDISKGFMIGGHSSGYWYDNSYLKNVFSGLDNLKSGDIVELIRDDGIKITYKVKNKEIKKLSDKITLSNKFYIYTCYPIGTNKKRLVIELEEIKK